MMHDYCFGCGCLDCQCPPARDIIPIELDSKTDSEPDARNWLLSEIASCREFLRELPATRVIERHGFERRLIEAQQRIDELDALPPPTTPLCPGCARPSPDCWCDLFVHTEERPPDTERYEARITALRAVLEAIVTHAQGCHDAWLEDVATDALEYDSDEAAK